MAWKIEFSRSVDKEFSKVPTETQKRIISYLKKLKDDPRAHGIAMQGSSNIKLWRYRVGDYRLICQIKDQELLILVVKIGKRDYVYSD